MSKHIPWIPYKATEWLEKTIGDGQIKTVFEYGSGESTLFFQESVDRVVTVEHNENWYLRTKVRINPQIVKLICAPPLELLEGEVVPPQYGSAASSRLNFCDYVESINANDERYDLVVVDGRARSGCIAAAIPHIRPSGFLMLDNSSRGRYQEAIKVHLSAFKTKHVFSGHGPIEIGKWSATVWCIDGTSKKES